MAAKSTGGSVLDRLSTVGRVGFALVFVLLIGGAYFVMFYQDVASAIEQSQQRSLDLGAELDRSEAAKAAYQKDLEEKARSEQEEREQKRVLPDESETPAFLASVQSVATISGVTLTSWSPMDETSLEFYAKIPMKLTLTGRFHQIAKFFYEVGHIDRIINAENIQIKSPKSTDDAVDVQVECLATAFRALSAKPATSGRQGARQ